MKDIIKNIKIDIENIKGYHPDDYDLDNEIDFFRDSLIFKSQVLEILDKYLKESK